MLTAVLAGILVITVKIPAGEPAAVAQSVSTQLGIPVVMSSSSPVGQELSVPVYEDVAGGLVAGQVRIASALGLKGEVSGAIVGMAAVAFPASYPGAEDRRETEIGADRFRYEGGKVYLNGEGAYVSVATLDRLMPNTEFQPFLRDSMVAVGMQECLETDFARRIALATGGVYAELESGEILIGVDRAKFREKWVAKIEAGKPKQTNLVEAAVVKLKKRLVQGLTDEQVSGLLAARGNNAQQLFAPEDAVFVDVQKIMRLRYEQLEAIYDPVERAQEQSAFWRLYLDVDWGQPVRAQFVATDTVEVALQTKSGGWVKGIL